MVKWACDGENATLRILKKLNEIMVPLKIAGSRTRPLPEGTPGFQKIFITTAHQELHARVLPGIYSVICKTIDDAAQVLGNNK